MVFVPGDKRNFRIIKNTYFGINPNVVNKTKPNPNVFSHLNPFVEAPTILSKCQCLKIDNKRELFGTSILGNPAGCVSVGGWDVRG